jgi:tetratricopeptide (TPR) repeat protein
LVGSEGAPKQVQVPEKLGLMLLKGEIDIAQMVGLKREVLYAIARVGHGFLESGAHDKALTIYQGLVGASPRDSVFHGHLAAVLVRLERYEEALKHYGESLNFNPFNVDSLAGRGELLLRMKKVPEALSDLTRAVKADTTKKRPSARRAAAMLMLLDQKLKSARAQKSAEAPRAKPAKKPSKKT